ncbi:MAG: hypothetical protein ACRDHZ_21110 [Ktedonobacteraceae bacterium]
MNPNATPMTIGPSLTTLEVLELADTREACLPHTSSCYCLFCGEVATHGEYCASCWQRYADEYLTWYEGPAHLILIDVLTLQALRAWIETTPRNHAGYPGDGVACPLAFYLNDLTGSSYEWCVDTESATEQRDIWSLEGHASRLAYQEFASYALPEWACELIQRVDACTCESPLTKTQFLSILDALEVRYPTAA